MAEYVEIDSPLNKNVWDMLTVHDLDNGIYGVVLVRTPNVDTLKVRRLGHAMEFILDGSRGVLWVPELSRYGQFRVTYEVETWESRMRRLLNGQNGPEI